MTERTGLITMQGNPLTLVDSPLEAKSTAPDFTVINTDLQPVSLGNFQNQALILASVPSLDTSVCSEETKRFNEEAAKLDKNISVLTISMDLPFAQKRWVEEHQANNLITLSDHKEASFGLGYGLLIKELRLLARAVFLVNQNRQVVYSELVPEITNTPDYDSVLKAVQELI